MILKIKLFFAFVVVFAFATFLFFSEAYAISGSTVESHRASLSLFSNQFMSQHYDRTAKRNFQFLSGRFSNNDSANGYNLDVEGAISPSATILNYVNIKEIYFKNDELRLGRAKSDWSELDERFSIGLFQPQFRWNPLDPQSQGLTGMFWSKQNSKGSGFEIFVSPFFIPDQLPNFEVNESGQFIESNPYFRTPPSQVSLNGSSIPFSYDLIKPPVDQIVLNSSFAARIFFKNGEEGWFGSLAYAYKPANQIMVGVHASELKINLVSGDTSPVVVAPKLWYHSLVSSEVGFRNQAWRSGLSFLYESPENPEFPTQFSRLGYQPALLSSPYISYKNASLMASISYLSIQSNKPVIETRDESNRELYSKVLFPRFFFTDAFLISGSYEFRVEKGHPLVLNTQWLRGVSDEFNLLKLGLAYTYQKKYSFFVASELINVSDEIEASQVALKTYRDNDSTSLGVSYVF
jgi:hypothetical protein